MKGYSVYSQIQQLKEKGFKKAAIAKQLEINRRTVNRYEAGYWLCHYGATILFPTPPFLFRTEIVIILISLSIIVSETYTFQKRFIIYCLKSKK